MDSRLAQHRPGWRSGWRPGWRTVLRIVLPAALTYALFAAGIFLVLLPGQRDAVMQQKRSMLKELSKSAWHVLERYHERELLGDLTRAEAQRRAAQAINHMRYGPDDKDYFWIHTLEPRMVMHPYRPDLDGTGLEEFADPKGKHLFVEMAELVQRRGSGFVDYWWQRRDNPEDMAPKLSYVIGFQPWEWIVGTGLYLDDVHDELARARRSMLLICLGISLASGLLLAYLVRRSLRAENARARLTSTLAEKERRFHAVFDQAYQYAGLLEPDGSILEINRTALDSMGVDLCQVRGLALWDAPWFTDLPGTQDDVRSAVARAAKGETVRTELFQNTAGDGLRTVDLSIKPLLDEDGRVAMLIPEGRDITERKQVEERLRASLAEKEVLLQEVHHRVKNNLQIVSSLLHLQEPEGGETLPLFRESQARIRTMALVHEELYRSKDLGRIELTGYARKLVQGLHSLFGAEQVRCTVSGSGDILVSMDQAVPLGLMLNELAVNAMTHAFPDGREGHLLVDLAMDDGHVLLTVDDDGVGLPDDLDAATAASLGLQLVQSLADQLGGSLDIASEGGARFRVRFPLARPEADAP